MTIQDIIEGAETCEYKGPLKDYSGAPEAPVR